MKIDRYRVRRLIKRGGFAEVFEAVAEGENGFERPVAIKRLLPARARDETLRRTFFDEARIAGRLNHPGIVSILDFGMADDLPFQVLELVDGRDLSALAEPSVPPILAVHLVGEVARALEYAHAMADDAGQPLGIVHRDVTPSNILVSWSGDVKLADFGIARARVREAETQLGVVKGTLAYMAPEQARGSMVDGRADIYALGCVLHRLIVGTSPLEDEAMRLRAMAGGSIEVDPRVPEEIASIVRRAVRGEPRDRHPDAGALADACWELVSRRADRDARALLREWVQAKKQPEDTRILPVDLTFELTLEDADPEQEVKLFTTALLSSGSTDRPLAVGGVPTRALVTAAAAAALIGATALLVVNGSTEPVSVARSAPNVVARALEEPAPTAAPREPDEPQVEEVVEPLRTRRRAKRERRAAAVDERLQWEDRLAERLRSWDLALEDLERDPGASARLRRLRASPGRRDLEGLLQLLPELAGDPAALERRFRSTLDELRRSRNRLSSGELAALEGTYLELRERFDAGPSLEERRSLSRELREIERKLEQPR